MFRTREKTKLVGWFFMHSMLPFVIEFFVLAPLVLGLDVPGVEPLYVFVAPWVLLAIGVLNLPFVGGGFRAFRMDPATRRNHALEHATIYFLRLRGKRRIAGEASSKGFRISGGASIADIRAGFESVRQLVREQRRLPHISRSCGSNRVTALGLAMLLLFAVTVASVVLRPPLVFRVAALAVAVVFFLGLRHNIGDWIQGRFFMATDFQEVSMRNIRKVKSAPYERPPVYFVETIIRVARTQASNLPLQPTSGVGV